MIDSPSPSPPCLSHLGLVYDSRNLARRIPLERFIAKPSGKSEVGGYTSQSVAQKSVSGQSELKYNTTRQVPVT